jgi:outer membrane biosynthesis protein TonB
MALFLSARPAGATTPAETSAPGEDTSATAASECLIVYPLDQHPDAAGARYIYYGNGFFVNGDGYLVTAGHVVSSFRNGGEPYVLVGPKNGPHHLVPAELVAADWAHDVAVLRATPNPFAKDYGVRFFPLTTQRPATGKDLLVLSLRPIDQENANSAEAPLANRESGKLLSVEFAQGETPGTGRELLAMSQSIQPGQSGSPVLAADSHEVVGVVLGRWLRPGVISLSNTADPAASAPGAVLPIHYAVALLHEHGIAWQTVAAAADLQNNQAAPPATPANTPPVPLSVIGTSYPPQALFGGEVDLDAVIDADGNLAEVNLVHGQPPFLAPVVDAVRTWTFEPARVNGVATEAHLSIIFQFPQSFLPPLTTQERTFGAPSADAADRSAIPLYTHEPNYPFNTVAEGSVAVFGVVDQQGQFADAHVLQDLPPLTNSVLEALHSWRFAPAEQSGTPADSATMVVFTFRRPAVR